MLRLRRIEIENFVCFDALVIEPSIENERPLTVIRAENGSGKTTFLRALRWGMYGDKGLPGNLGSVLTSSCLVAPKQRWYPDESHDRIRD